eukprot:COSAG06_NODE_8169_length_2251_cov_2.691914_4_plen_191_part_01
MEWDRQYTNILGNEKGNTPELAETCAQRIPRICTRPDFERGEAGGAGGGLSSDRAGYCYAACLGDTAQMSTTQWYPTSRIWSTATIRTCCTQTASGRGPVTTGGRSLSSPGEKTVCVSPPFFFNTKMIILPRQARDKHRESTQKRAAFSDRLFNESPVKDTIAVNDRWGNDCRGKHGALSSQREQAAHSAL